MHYEYVAIPDADVPRAVEPGFQHALDTYASETNMTASMWRPQRYGTQYDWTERGELAPWVIEDEAGVDDRRRAVGLPPLAENTDHVREGIERDREGPPPYWHGRLRKFMEWVRSVGWRE